MALIIKVKGVDDFGKERSGNQYQYSHHYPRVANGDFLFYVYPKENAIGIYQACDELEYYEKDGFCFCRGLMNRYNGTPQSFLDFVKKQNVSIAEKFENSMNDIIKKYF